MNIKVLGDRVLILPIAKEEKTVSGIIIPNADKDRPLQCEVISVGSGTKDEEMLINVGDIVLCNKHFGMELEHEGTKYFIMRQRDILAILNNK